MDVEYYVLFCSHPGCGYVSLDEPAKGPVSGYEYQKSATNPKVLRFATEQNATFYVKRMSPEWLENLDKAGTIKVERVSP